ncbi:MAG: aldo/keto reductase [Acidimicrobiia bacterium]|nr:aldo/keto reductase [Acidimicrobiia bacterium]
MEHRSLGTSGLDLSVFGLGTMTFGAEADETTSFAILDRFVAEGGTFIDTADVYSRGRSEQIIGSWLAARGGPDGLTIATKARFPMSDDPGDRGAGRAHLEQAIDASLGRLGVDVIDLYQVHAWDPETPLEETLETLNDLVTAGKIRHAGVSNFTGWQLQRAVLTARHRGWAPIESLQPKYSLLSRDIELELLPLCLEENLGVLPWSPLGGGWLSGKYTPEERPTGATRLGENPARGIEAYDLRNTDRTWSILEVVRVIATARDATMSQVALNWVRGRPGVTSVLLGARTVDQLVDNLTALSWELNDNEISVLNEVSAPGIPIYPHGFMEAYAGVTIWEDLMTRVEPPAIGR